MTLAACSLPKPEQKKDDGAGGATFVVKSADGLAQSEETAGEFSIPKAKIYNFNVCLQDLVREKPIPGQDFRIVETDVTKTTDSNGCVSWSEKLEFNYLAQSTYVRIERTVQAKGFQRGSRKIELAINPWSHGEDTSKAIDLSKNQVAVLVKEPSEMRLRLKGRNDKDQAQTRRIVLEDLRLIVADEKLTAQGLSLTYQLAGVPSIRLSKMNGQMFLQPLTAGRFNARLQLIHQDVANGQERRRTIFQSELKEQKLANGALSLRFPLILPDVPTSGQIQLGLTLEPVGAPEGLLAFEGLFPVGDHRAIKSAAMLKISPLASQNEDFKIAAYAPPANDTVTMQVDGVTTTVPAANGHVQRAKVEADRFQFALIRRGAENATEKEVVYRVKTCLRSGVDQEGLRSRKIRVTKFRTEGTDAAETVELVTDNSACLAWYETIKVKYYDCQRFLKGTVTLENADLGWKENFAYIVNPWEYQGTFAMDSRDIDPKENVKLLCEGDKKIKGQIDLDSYAYTTLSYDYAIDAHLNLSVKKKIQFRLDPKVLLYSSLASGIMDRQPLRDGPYLLRALVVRNRDYDSNNSYVTHAEKLVQVMGGRLATDVEFATSDLKALRNRNTLLVDLNPVKVASVHADDKGLLVANDPKAPLESLIDKDAELSSHTYAGPITLSNDEASKSLRIAEKTALAGYLIDGKLSADAHDESSLLPRLVKEGLARRDEQLKELQTPLDIGAWAKSQNILALQDKEASNFLKALNVDDKAYGQGRLVQVQKGFWQGVRDAATPLSTDKLSGLFEDKLDPQLARKLCVAFAQEFLADVIPAANVPLFGFECSRQVMTKGLRSFFSVEHRLRVHKLDGFEYAKGSRRTLSVGTGFQMSTTHTDTTATNASIGVNGSFSWKPMWFSLGVTGSYTLSHNVADAHATAQNVSVNEAVTLNVLENEFKLKIGSAEECVVVRMNADLFKTKPSKFVFYRPSDLKDWLRTDVSEEAKMAAISRGVLLCAGKANAKPLELTEKYYLVSQDMAESEVQDAGDPRNRAFFVGLRGESDYRRFLAMTKSHGPQEAPSDQAGFEDIGNALDKLFSTTITTPGQILIKK